MLTVTRDLPAISLSGNPMVIEVNSDNFEDSGDPRPFYALILDLYIYQDSSYVYLTSESIQVDEDGNASFDISELINREISPSHPYNDLDETTLLVKDANAVARIAYKISEGYGIPYVIQTEEIDNADYYAIPGGFADSLLEEIEEASSDQVDYIETKKMFLTNQHDGKKVALNQFECLRWLNSSESSASIKLKVKEYLFSEDDEIETTIYSGSLDALSLYSFNVTPGVAFTPDSDTYKWEIYLTDGSDVLISEVLEYRFTEVPVTNERFILFQNSVGGFDTVRAVGDFISALEGMNSVVYLPEKTTLRNTLTPQQDRSVTRNVFKGKIGYLTNAELQWLAELFLSEQRFIIINEKAVEIAMLNSDYLNQTDQPPAEFNIEAVVGVMDKFYSKAR